MSFSRFLFVILPHRNDVNSSVVTIEEFKIGSFRFHDKPRRFLKPMRFGKLKLLIKSLKLEASNLMFDRVQI